MKRMLKRTAAVVLTLIMLLQTSEGGLLIAAEAVNQVLNPAEQIELTVPEELRDGNNYFFIRQDAYNINEDSGETLYIPIQRTGNLDAEADVTLKVVDITARHDVNYKVELYKDSTEPEVVYGDVSILDLALNAEGQSEVEPLTDDELGELIYEGGGADIVDTEGNTVATVTAYPLDENGNPVEEESEAAPEAVETEAAPVDTEVEAEPVEAADVPAEDEPSAETEEVPAGTDETEAVTEGTSAEPEEIPAETVAEEIPAEDEAPAETVVDETPAGTDETPAASNDAPVVETMSAKRGLFDSVISFFRADRNTESAELQDADDAEPADENDAESTDAEPIDDAESTDAEPIDDTDDADAEPVDDTENAEAVEPETVETDDTDAVEAVATDEADNAETVEDVANADDAETVETVEVAEPETVEPVATGDIDAAETVEIAEPEAVETDDAETVETVETVAEAVADRAQTAETLQEPDDATLSSADETAWSTGKGPAALMAARNAYTGTVSDRQEMVSSQNLLESISGAAGGESAELQSSDAPLMADDYPGKEYHLHFKAGQEAKYLVITPLYSDANDGDAQIMLMLKNPSEGMQLPQNVGPTVITLLDVDEPETVYISMAKDTVTAENGKANITVTRRGRINAIVGVHVASWDGSAKQGDEYSGIGADLYFPLGITSRTLELPVWHGTEEKDFSVTLTAVTDVEIDRATTHVIIPAAPDEETATLLADDNRYGDRWNLQVLKTSWAGRTTEFRDNGYGVFLKTAEDKEDEPAWIVLDYPYSYAYDGVRMEYNFHTNWADGRAIINKKQDDNSSWSQIAHTDHGDCATRNGQVLTGYYGSAKSPYRLGLDVVNYDNSWRYLSRDCHADMTVTALKPIKRDFTVKLETPDALAFEGMTSQQVLEQYQSVMLDNSLNKSHTYMTGDSFSVSRMGNQEWARFKELVVVRKSDGATRRLGSMDGKNQTVSVTLNEDTINTLGWNNFIEWKKADNGSYSGTITVKPVFEYVKNVTVSVRSTPYGVLKYNNGKTLAAGTHTFHYGDKLVFEPNVDTQGTFAGVQGVGVGYKRRHTGASGTITAERECEYYIDNSGKANIDSEPCFILNDDFYEFWQVFSEEQNRIQVRVPVSHLDAFDTTKGFFAGATPGEIVGGYQYYTVKDSILTNELIQLIAVPQLQSDVPLWEIGEDTSKRYSGEVFYFYADARAVDNVITLRSRLQEEDLNSARYPWQKAEKLNSAWYRFSGSIYTSTLNLRTGQDADDQFTPAKNTQGVIAMGLTGAVTDYQKGTFEVQPQYLTENTYVRYVVTYNGNASIREVKVPDAASKTESVTYRDINGKTITRRAVPVSLGSLKMENWAHSGAHFQSVSANLDDYSTYVTNTFQMSGRKLTVDITVNPGQGWRQNANGEQVSDAIHEVILYFQNQATGEIHGFYSTLGEDGANLKWNADTNTATLSILKFSPDSPELYTYGDVLMAQLVTGEGSDLMYYAPVSTGYSVIADRDYTPQTFNFDINSLAEALQIRSPGNISEDGELKSADASLMDDDTRYSFGAFPFIGEVTALVNIFTTISNSMMGTDTKAIIDDLDRSAALEQTKQNISQEDKDAYIKDHWGDNPNSSFSIDQDQMMNDIAAQKLADDGLFDTDDDDDNNGNDSGEGGKTTSWKVNVAFQIKETSYGGVRFMLAVVVSTGGGKGYESQKNPYSSASYAWQYFTGPSSSSAANLASGAIELITEEAPTRGEELRSSFGGPYFTISLYVGVYLDYGYVQIEKNGGTEISHDMIFMGAGGFFGGRGTVGVTVPIMLIVVPAYFNGEASLALSFYLGASADPSQTLDSFYETKELKGQDFGFNFEFNGAVQATATIGIGIYKVIGARVSAGVVFDAGYGLNMAEWYPNVGTDWGYTLDATFSGSIDLIITSIDLYSFSWPTGVAYGWTEYFQEVRRANLLITYVRNGINKGRGNSTTRREAGRRADMVADMVDKRNASIKFQNLIKGLKDQIKFLRQYAYDSGIITWTENNRVQMNKQGGVIGAALDTAALSGYQETALFHTRDHVSSRWVAGDSAQLMSAFSAVNTERIVEDAVSQTASRLMNIGGNKFLMVFLDDDASRDRMQASVLKWTVYNANNDTWTDPVVVQNDATADGKPNLVDADSKVILSWASTSDEKYQALKDTVAAELKAADGVEPDDYLVQETLESDPVRVMEQMDIFTVEFDKDTQTFGEIEQLSDDEYYDDYPQAVYDSETGDYIVMYYKTAQDTAEYDSAQDKLMDVVGFSPDPEKTYSVLCYMLYNNQTDAEDTTGQTHESGWARNYYFPNETDLDEAGQLIALKNYGGQRFLPSTLREEDGGQSDPPIGEITVSSGYNGFAAYAFTVDQDFDLDTTADRALYLQLYRFADHKTYVPIRIAGETSENGVTEQVDIGTPRLIRNKGSTWLFWRENRDSLRYLNVSELLSAKVPGTVDAEEEDLIYAVQDDGTFAVYQDGLGNSHVYAPDVHTVDFGSRLTPTEMNITEYEVITDADDNLYVVWTDVMTSPVTDEVTGETYPVGAQEIYATAMIKEEDRRVVSTDEGEQAEDVVLASWSKPYRLTRANNYNDGLAIALDDDGGLIIVHNQYDKLLCDNEDKLLELVNSGQVGIAERDVDGDGEMEQCVLGSLYYNSPISLMVTRCDRVSSLEATNFTYSHSYPVPGEAVIVTTSVENVGLTSAHGCDVTFYEYKDGVQGRKIAETSTDALIPVNTAEDFSFAWAIPDDGVEGYQIQAVISEKAPDGNGSYPPAVSYSDKFTTGVRYGLSMVSLEQNGDQFDMTYRVENFGNENAPEGTVAAVNLVGLYGDLQERYGMEDRTLVSEDISGLAPREVRLISKSVTIPVSVFQFCGYDAVQVVACDENGTVLEETTQYIVQMDEPVNLRLNNGSTMTLNAGATKKAALSYESTVFIDANMEANGSVAYSVDDPAIASVDAEGNVTGLDSGSTTLTATLLPGGRTVSVEVSVLADGETPDNPSTKQGCYVATAVYGSYDCPEVWTLRRFRDEVLADTWYGRLFIRAYYALSPTAVKLFGDCDWFRNFFRDRLDQMVSNLQSDGFASTPYEDRAW